MMNALVSNTYGYIVLRFALVFLFLWFGWQQVYDPSGWVAWLPEWTAATAPFSALAPEQLVLLNGTFELVLGLFLLVGIWIRWVALLLALHLFFIAYEIGFNDIGVRDFALALCTLALALSAPDKFSMDHRRAPAAPPPKPLF